MRVVFVTLVDLTGTSGQNVYSRNVASALAGHDNVRLTLVCPEPADRLPSKLSAACEGIATLSVKNSQSLRWHIQAQRILYRQLKHLLNTKSIDIVLSTLRPSLLAPAHLAHRHNAQYRVLVEGRIGHGVDNLSVLPLDSLFSDLVSIYNLRALDQCYVVNRDVEKWVRSLPLCEPSIEVLPHGVDIPRLLRNPGQRSTPVLSNSDYEFSLCYVGSFKEYHCIHSLIRAVSQLREQDLDIGLSLVGTGPELDSIRVAVDEHGIERAVTFHGFISPEIVPLYIQSADACYGAIDPARVGSPMKVYEYLANGSPVIATASQEFTFIEEEHIGVLIEEPSPETVTNGIKEIYTASEPEHSRMRERARSAGHQYGHTWQEFANQIIAR